MFRGMRRYKQELTKEECINILINEPRGILSVLGDDGYPYGMVMNHWYNTKDGKLYFHCAKEGHKIDAIKACDKVSYCVHDEGFRKEGEWALNIKSIIVFGRIRIIKDEAKMREICTNLYRKFSDDEKALEEELVHLNRVMCLEITVEHMTGKLVKES